MVLRLVVLNFLAGSASDDGCDTHLRRGDSLAQEVDITKHPDEADIGRFFSGEPPSTHADNHCIPVYDVLQVPNEEQMELIVMPLLSDWEEPPLDTVGETIEFFRQLFTMISYYLTLCPPVSHIIIFIGA